jgi:hypothetical protein
LAPGELILLRGLTHSSVRGCGLPTASFMLMWSAIWVTCPVIRRLPCPFRALSRGNH